MAVEHEHSDPCQVCDLPPVQGVKPGDGSVTITGELQVDLSALEDLLASILGQLEAGITVTVDGGTLTVTVDGEVTLDSDQLAELLAALQAVVDAIVALTSEPLEVVITNEPLEVTITGPVEITGTVSIDPAQWQALLDALADLEVSIDPASIEALVEALADATLTVTFDTPPKVTVCNEVDENGDPIPLDVTGSVSVDNWGEMPLGIESAALELGYTCDEAGEKTGIVALCKTTDEATGETDFEPLWFGIGSTTPLPYDPAVHGELCFDPKYLPVTLPTCVLVPAAPFEINNGVSADCDIANGEHAPGDLYTFTWSPSVTPDPGGEFCWPGASPNPDGTFTVSGTLIGDGDGNVIGIEWPNNAQPSITDDDGVAVLPGHYVLDGVCYPISAQICGGGDDSWTITGHLSPTVVNKTSGIGITAIYSDCDSGDVIDETDGWLPCPPGSPGANNTEPTSSNACDACSSGDVVIDGKTCKVPFTPECIVRRKACVGYDNGRTPGSSDGTRPNFVSWTEPLEVVGWQVNGATVGTGSVFGPWPNGPGSPWTLQLQGWADFKNAADPNGPAGTNTSTSAFGFLPAPTWRYCKITACDPYATYGDLVVKRTDTGEVFTIYPLDFGATYDYLWRFGMYDCDTDTHAVVYCKQNEDGTYETVDAPTDPQCWVPCGTAFDYYIDSDGSPCVTQPPLFACYPDPSPDAEPDAVINVTVIVTDCPDQPRSVEVYTTDSWLGAQTPDELVEIVDFDAGLLVDCESGDTITLPDPPAQLGENCDSEGVKFVQLSRPESCGPSGTFLAEPYYADGTLTAYEPQGTPQLCDDAEVADETCIVDACGDRFTCATVVTPINGTLVTTQTYVPHIAPPCDDDEAPVEGRVAAMKTAVRKAVKSAAGVKVKVVSVAEVNTAIAESYDVETKELPTPVGPVCDCPCGTESPAFPTIPSPCGPGGETPEQCVWALEVDNDAVFQVSEGGTLWAICGAEFGTMPPGDYTMTEVVAWLTANLPTGYTALLTPNGEKTSLLSIGGPCCDPGPTFQFGDDPPRPLQPCVEGCQTSVGRFDPDTGAEHDDVVPNGSAFDITFNTDGNAFPNGGFWARRLTGQGPADCWLYDAAGTPQPGRFIVLHANDLGGSFSPPGNAGWLIIATNQFSNVTATGATWDPTVTPDFGACTRAEVEAAILAEQGSAFFAAAQVSQLIDDGYLVTAGADQGHGPLSTAGGALNQDVNGYAWQNGTADTDTQPYYPGNKFGRCYSTEPAGGCPEHPVIDDPAEPSADDPVHVADPCAIAKLCEVVDNQQTMIDNQQTIIDALQVAVTKLCKIADEGVNIICPDDDGGGEEPPDGGAQCATMKLGADITSTAPGNAVHTLGSLFDSAGPLPSWSGTFTIVDSAGGVHTLADGATITGLASGATQSVSFSGTYDFVADGETFRCNVTDKLISAGFVAGRLAGATGLSRPLVVL